MDNDGPRILRGLILHHTLGTGGTAEAVLERRDPLVVLKEMEFGSRYTADVDVLGHILPPHKGIVYLLDHEPENERAGQPGRLLLEYCDGGDLFKILRTNPHRNYTPEAFIWHVFLRLAESIAFMHSGWSAERREVSKPWTTVLHHDLKPDNIFTKKRPDDYPDVIIGDFGHAQVPSAANFRPDFAWGTPEFDPPERPCSDEKGDIWSLGSIIHWMIHQGRNAVGPICDNPWNPLDGGPRLRGHIPEDYAGWERAAAEKWPESRYLRQPRTDHNHFYSKCLYFWMARCLSYDPCDRPTAVELAREMAPVARKWRDAHYEALSTVPDPMVYD